MEIASHYFNNTIATLKQVIDAGIAEYERQGGMGLKNQAQQLLRVRIKQKELQLPEPSQFHELVGNLRKKSGGWSERIGDLIEFLAYSGLRIRSEALWVTWEDIDWQRKEIIVRGHPETGTKNSDIRRVPIIADMDNLLKRLQTDPPQTGRILEIARCHEALARACKEIGIPRLTHHDLRHLFATRCIESGVDVPTVARWLGHKDGGSLALRTYGHLRNEHSQTNPHTFERSEASHRRAYFPHFRLKFRPATLQPGTFPRHLFPTRQSSRECEPNARQCEADYFSLTSCSPTSYPRFRIDCAQLCRWFPGSLSTRPREFRPPDRPNYPPLQRFNHLTTPVRPADQCLLASTMQPFNDFVAY